MRIIKQLIYGIFYSAIIVGVGFSAYRLNIFTAPTCLDGRLNQQEVEVDCGGPNCQSCEVARLQPIQTGVQYFPVGSNTNAIISFSNPNLEYGADFSFTLSFYGVNQEKLFSMTRDAFVYSAEAQRVVVEPNLPFNSGRVFGSPEVIIANPNWKSKTQFAVPEIQLRQINLTVSGNRATVNGIIANRESSSIAEVTIGVVIVRKDTKAQIGASKTILQSIRPFEERAFSVAVPISQNLKASEIEAQIYPGPKR